MSIALITGGSRGLGRSMALAVAAQGVDVILTYVSKQAEAEQTAKEIEALGRKAETLRLNVADTASFAAFADSVRGVLAARWQRQDFDFLVNNAGIGIHAPFAQTTEEQFDKLMNIHVKGVFFLTQKLLPLLCEGGRIEAAAAAVRGRPHHQRVVGSDALQHAGIRGLCGHEGCGGGADALPGARAGRPADRSQCGGSGRHRDGL